MKNEKEMIGCKSKDWNPGVLSLPIRVLGVLFGGFKIGELIAFPSGLLGDFWGFIWGFLSLPRRVLSGFSGNFRGSFRGISSVSWGFEGVSGVLGEGVAGQEPDHFTSGSLGFHLPSH